MTIGAVDPYKETAKEQFPLILVVCREASSAEDLEYKFGYHDFDEFPRTGTWNQSYGLVSRVLTGNPSTTCRYLKDICYKNRMSPIVFTDASPRPIENGVSRKCKYEIRQSIPQEKFREHVREILYSGKFADIIERVEVIILAVNEPLFEPALDEYRKYAKNNGVCIFETLFMSGYNNKRMEKQLNETQKERREIERVARQFMEEVENV